ncbi:MAG TPA: hypothetical protein VEI80_00865, partial [Candidatus Acidoferrales bacterium]|nr:hypothetical protein [Candidatus Acidoferrales bacterium]
MIVVVSVLGYWFFFNGTGELLGSSRTSTLLTSPPLRASDFFFNYSKCRVGDVMYVNFYVTNTANATVDFLNASVRYDSFVFSNGTVIYSNQVHFSAVPTVGSVGRWHMGIPVVGFWANDTSVSSVKMTFAVFITE